MVSFFPLAPPLITALMGAAVGSFLNVVTWRLPRQESILWPSSHCPRCGTTLAWWDNVPVLSWLLLRGRCRYCKAPISSRYPLVESACALLWLITLLAQPAAMGPAPDPLLLMLAGWTLVSWMIPLVLIDLDSLWLPEPLCRWGLVTGLVVTALLGFQQVRRSVVRCCFPICWRRRWGSWGSSSAAPWPPAPSANRPSDWAMPSWPP